MECVPKMRSMEFMPKMMDKEYGMYAQQRMSMEFMPKMRDKEYGMYAQNEG